MSGLMAESTKESGRTTICTEKESTLGKTVASTKVSTSMTENMALESTPGRMDANMKVTGTMASSTVKEFTANPMEWSDGVAGRKERGSPGWMSSAPTYNNNDKVGNLQSRLTQ